ncbi:hypothetical protein BsWGS_24104 [Bradybaena similaris]
MARNTISAEFWLCFIIFVSLTCVVNGDETHGTHVVSYDSKTFAEGLKNNRNFVMFYAPWCGHCKNIGPTWEELGRIYNTMENSPVVISKVDCTVYRDLCAVHNIIGFPTLTLFSAGGSRHVRYKGRRNLESLKMFLQQKSDDTESETAEAKDGEESTIKHKEHLAEVDDPKIGPVILTNDNFSDKIGAGYFFIDFYAPWCGHCKKLAPAWNDLAKTFNPQNKVTIAKVDCTQSATICKEHGITGYPTLLWFVNGQKIEKYSGQRTYEALKKYVSDKLSEDAVDRVDEKLPASQKTTRVVELTDETIESHIASNGLVFVKFVVHWCSHCKQLAPVWEELAEAFQDQPVSITHLDCTRYSDVCKRYQIKGYPTLKLFSKGAFLEDYRGFRKFDSLQKYLAKRLRQQEHDEL